MKRHIALVGDSIFDNKSYTGKEPDVTKHLSSLVKDNWEVTLCAVDGATTQDVGEQYNRIPQTASHVVLSLGGNDAIMSADLLETEVTSTGETLDLFKERLDLFEKSYGDVLEALLTRQARVTVCTIYNGDLPDAYGPRARVSLMMFNDVIIRTALKNGVDVIDLRSVCTEASDYANPIEPSGKGGLKIAKAVAIAVGAIAYNSREMSTSVLWRRGG